MKSLRVFALKVCIGILGFTASSAFAEFVTGSQGTDGVFHPLADVVVDLAQASAGEWSAPAVEPGRGVYDERQWAVVFKYESVHIPAGVTVAFANHPSGAPVVWLVGGDVIIEGAVNLDGLNGAANAHSFTTPGPGGFAGGGEAYVSNPASGGFGPGGAERGAEAVGAGGGYATQGEAAGGGAVYGVDTILPLIGGSGGAAGATGAGGAGGGGILIAADHEIQIIGQNAISARGGDGEDPFGGGGSGGAIRLLADIISGSGSLRAAGGAAGDQGTGLGGDGRIRVETNLNQFSGLAEPAPTFGPPVFIFPPDSAPALRITHVNGVPVPVDPRAGVSTIDVGTGMLSAVIAVEARNVPVGATVSAYIKAEGGDATSFLSTPLRGTRGCSTATVDVLLPQRRAEIYLRANWSTRRDAPGEAKEAN